MLTELHNQTTLLAPVDMDGDKTTVGLSALTIPEDYILNGFLDLGIWETKRDRMILLKFPLSPLSAQTATRTIVLAGSPGLASAANMVTVTFNPKTNTINTSGTDRIIYATATL